MRKVLLVVAVLAAAFGVSTSAASAGVLTVTFSGSGTGTVTSDPAGIGCSNVPGSAQTTCSHDFGPVFDSGTLTATAGEDSGFVSWSGGGGTCTGATNPCVTGLLFFDMAVTAKFAPKPDPPALTTGTPTDVVFPSATVHGTVNPGSDDFAVSDCYFEYGLTTDYGEKVACHPGAGAIGTGTSPVPVSASIGVLDPGKTYYYRLVATNGGGTSRSAGKFTSGAAPADDCPNAAIRAQQGALAQRLPNCGAYELVSPVFTAGQSAQALAGTADGNRTMVASVGGFAGVENLPDIGTIYATERTDSGWTTSAITPPASAYPLMQRSALDYTRDGSRSLWFMTLKVDEGTGRFTPIVRDPDGSFHVAGPTQEDPGNLPVATSEDLGTVVQATTTRPVLTDGTVDARSSSAKSLYVSTRGADGRLSVRQVAYRAGATMFPHCGANAGGSAANITGIQFNQNSVSSDGQKIFFTSVGLDVDGCRDPDVRRVWAKVGGDDPIDLSASQCAATCGPERAAYFRGASRDGSRVYFLTEQRLLPEDEDTSEQNDLYEYDFNATGQKLRLITGGADPVGAGVFGGGIFQVSGDGAYVYFMAAGRALAGPNRRGAFPQPGDFNLYVYHRAAGHTNGTTTFVGALARLSEGRSQVSSTGRYFLIQSTANLTGERLAGDVLPDLYRYDADEDELLRVWTDDPAHNGTSRVDGTTLQSGGSRGNVGMQARGSGEWQPGLQVSDDGSLVGFTTKEPLSRDDRNAASDAYLWEAATGRMTMLTDGTSKPANQFSGSQFNGMTPSGDSLFVSSASPLLREHTSGQGAAYVIRKNGGFLEPDAPAAPCVDDACQGPEVPAPGPFAGAGSSAFAGGGNVVLPRADSKSNERSKVRLAKVKAVRGSRTRVRVSVPSKGKIRVSGSGLARTSKLAKKAGSYRVTVKLSKRAKRTLQRKGRVKVRVRVRFSPAEGRSSSARRSVTFTAAKKRTAKASSRSVRRVSVLSSDVQKGR